MRSFTLLSCYLGCYDRWQEIRKRYSLKWTASNESLVAMKRWFFDNELSLDKMIERIKEMAHKLRPYGQNSSPIRVLVGLRPSEVVGSMRLINYITNYSRLITILRRCDFTALQIPQFLRTTKKAYLSFVSPKIISNVSSSSNITDKIPSSNAIKLSCRRKGIACDLHLCRKVHGYWLHQYNVTADEVDFLQGRVSTSVFSRHYLTPDSSLRTSVLDAFETPPQQLMMRIE